MRHHRSVLVPGRSRRGHILGIRRRERVVASVAFRLEHAQAPDELLDAVVGILHSELRLSYVRLEIGPGVWGDGVAVLGAPVGELLTLPLTYQGHPSGQLTVSGRRRGRAVSRGDHEALLEVARHAGPVLHTARLLGDLRQSLDGVLYAREEERRRLRHELHDSLGPILAGISLGLHAARRLMSREPEQADELVSHLEQELQAAIAEVRRLFETLRPPALDQLGLLPAVREHIDLLATRMRSDEDPAEQVSFELHHVGDLAALPAIVEIAAYRIVCEALTNVARHSGAHTCTVNLSRDKGVRVEVVDDGIGYSGRSGRGLGLGSMRERAAELGGTFLIESPPAGGTRVVVTLPVHPVPASR